MSSSGGGGDEAARRAEESLARIEAGGLPLAAQERLDALRARGGDFFTSDLSVQEFLLVRRAGFRPLTQVMGSCVYHVGTQWLPAWQPSVGAYGAGGAAAPWNLGQWQEGETVELETASGAWNEARRLALGRLREEAVHAGADAVVGVRIERGAYDWAAGLIEFVVTGTAVASDRYALDLTDGPLLSNLTGQEFAMLLEHGWLPAGLVAGSTVCYAMTGWAQTSGLGIFSSWQNQELPDFTRALYDARTQAMLRATRSAHELGAHGLVGMTIEHDEDEVEAERNGTKYTDLIVTMHVLGTAVAEVTGAGAEEPPVYIALPLDEERT